MMRSPSRIEIHRYEGRDAMSRLARALGDTGLVPTPVVEMEPAYLASGFEHHPGAIVAYRGARPVAYLPYALRRTAFPIAIGPMSLGRFPCRQLIVFGYTADAEDHASMLDAVFGSLAELDSWDVIQAFQVPADHPLAVYLAGNPFGNGDRYRSVCRRFDTIQVEIDGSFERYLARRFSRKTRYNLTREVRRLEEQVTAGVVVRICTSATEVPAFLRDAEAIARKTYQWKLGLATLRATPAQIRKTSFLAGLGRWRGYLLLVDGVPAAYCYATVRWDSLSYDAVGYDPRFARLNPGKVLLYRILQDLHDWRGVHRLEFGRGAAAYKRLFADAHGGDVDATCYRSSVYATLLRGLAVSADRAYYRLRPVLRPCMAYVKRLARTSEMTRATAR